MQRHQDVDCPMRLEPCPHCKNDVPIQQMQVSTEEFTFQQNQSLTCINAEGDCAWVGFGSGTETSIWHVDGHTWHVGSCYLDMLSNGDSVSILLV